MSVPGLWIPACIGVGSNQDGPVEQVGRALDALANLPQTRLIYTSSLYRNPPMGPVEQPVFINAAAVILTQLSARELLTCLQTLEAAHGRVHGEGPRWGPRCIDLDILTFGSRQIDEPDLVIPHPGILHRNFVLFPLLEICPDMMVPGRGAVRWLAASSDGTSLERISGA